MLVDSTNPVNRANPLTNGLRLWMCGHPDLQRVGGNTWHSLVGELSIPIIQSRTSTQWGPFSGGRQGATFNSTTNDMLGLEVGTGTEWHFNLSSFTISAYAVSSSVSNFPYLFVKKASAFSATMDYGIAINSNKIRFLYGGTEVGAAHTYDALAHTVTGTYDGTTMRTYLDGVEIANGSGPGSVTDNAWLIIGGLRNSSDAFTGAVDNCMLWNRAITPAEVFELDQEMRNELPTLLNWRTQHLYVGQESTGLAGNRRRRLLLSR